MKNLIEKINENKWDDSTGIPTWADFICVNINEEEIEFYRIKDIRDEKVKKLKFGESYNDEKNELIWVCMIDVEALNEK